MNGPKRYSRRQVVRGLGATLGVASGATGAVAGATSSSPQIDRDEDVTYAERPAGELELDLYVPDVDSPPLVVWLHGGGWQIRTRKNGPDLETYFAERGFAMATVSYRLSEIPDGAVPYLPVDPDNPTPRGTFPDHVVDVRAAIRWLRAHADEFGYDATNVGVWGESSGAHLACMAGALDDVTDVAGEVYPGAAVEKTVHPSESGRVQAVVAHYPAVDFLAMDPQRERVDVPPLFPPHRLPDSAESLMIGGPITDHEAKVERASPLTYVGSDDPPFLIDQGLQDRFLPHLQSRQLFETLRDAGVEATLYELPDRGHGYHVDDLAADPPTDQRVRSTTDAPDSPYGPDVVAAFLADNLA